MANRALIFTAIAAVAICALTTILIVVYIPHPIESECDPNPCANNGICVESSDGFICQCMEGYGGDDCTQQGVVSSCDPNPCQNDGVCVEGIAGRYTCQCKEGFEGDDCETEIIVVADPCNPSPCEHDGICTELPDNTAQCACKDGYDGEFCTEEEDISCEDSPCKNGGECVSRPLGDQCNCITGYAGYICTECDGLLLNGDQCYYAITGAFMNYTSAEKTCSMDFIGGHLAYIKDNETHAAVKQYLQSLPGLIGYDLAWIGASYDPMKGGDEITWNDGDVTNIGSWWHPGFPHTGARYRTAEKMKFDVADNDNIGYQGFVNWNPAFPNYPLCQFSI